MQLGVFTWRKTPEKHYFTFVKYIGKTIYLLTLI